MHVSQTPTPGKWKHKKSIKAERQMLFQLLLAGDSGQDLFQSFFYVSINDILSHIRNCICLPLPLFKAADRYNLKKVRSVSHASTIAELMAWRTRSFSVAGGATTGTREAWQRNQSSPAAVRTKGQ